uniref:Uncharacterized protein n=1 Tax=viral metagenome TaxID=1070528 RepID=A0A6H1ZHQ8_9ZZZZ
MDDQNTTFNIYFSDLNENCQQRLLVRFNMESPKEANWDVDVIPLAIIEMEDM